MSYKPVKCELTLIIRSIIPGMKLVFTNKNAFLWLILSIFIYNLILYLHDICVTMDA